VSACVLTASQEHFTAGTSDLFQGWLQLPCAALWKATRGLERHSFVILPWSVARNVHTTVHSTYRQRGQLPI